MAIASEHLNDNEDASSADNPSIRRVLQGFVRGRTRDNDRGHRQWPSIVQLSIEEEGLDAPVRASSDRRTHPIIRLRNDLHARSVFVIFTTKSDPGRSVIA